MGIIFMKEERCEMDPSDAYVAINIPSEQDPVPPTPLIFNLCFQARRRPI